MDTSRIIIATIAIIAMIVCYRLIMYTVKKKVAQKYANKPKSRFEKFLGW